MSRPRYDAELLAWIAARDQHRCHVCGAGFVRRDPWEIDHAVPFKDDARHLLNNLRLAHRSCNRSKGAA